MYNKTYNAFLALKKINCKGGIHKISWNAEAESSMSAGFKTTIYFLTLQVRIRDSIHQTASNWIKIAI